MIARSQFHHRPGHTSIERVQSALRASHLDALLRRRELNVEDAPTLTNRCGESVNVTPGRAGPRFDQMAAVAAATPAAEPPMMNVRRVMTMASKTATRFCR